MPRLAELVYMVNLAAARTKELSRTLGLSVSEDDTVNLVECQEEKFVRPKFEDAVELSTKLTFLMGLIGTLAILWWLIRCCLRRGTTPMILEPRNEGHVEGRHGFAWHVRDIYAWVMRQDWMQ